MRLNEYTFVAVLWGKNKPRIKAVNILKAKDKFLFLAA